MPSKERPPGTDIDVWFRDTWNFIASHSLAVDIIYILLSCLIWNKTLLTLSKCLTRLGSSVCPYQRGCSTGLLHKSEGYSSEIASTTHIRKDSLVIPFKVVILLPEQSSLIFVISKFFAILATHCETLNLEFWNLKTYDSLNLAISGIFDHSLAFILLEINKRLADLARILKLVEPVLSVHVLLDRGYNKDTK